MHKSFPMYTDYNPTVPVWCVTPKRNGCIHRFFDTSPISPSGRYMAVFQMPFEDHRPEPGDVGYIVLIDLESGDDKVIAETRGWEPQMGANINWGATDKQLFFNDVDTKTWTPFAWKYDATTGKKQRMEGSVYHASPDGKWLISANMTTMFRTQPGYGTRIPDELIRRNIGLSKDDGFTITDTTTGKSRLLVSIYDLFTKADPAIQMDDVNKWEIYGFHSKFNPQSTWLMLSLRWFPVQETSIFDMFKKDHTAVRFAWVTMPVDGNGPIHCAVGPEHWEKGGHHGTWFPDGENISMNLNINRDGLYFVRVNRNGEGLRKMLETTPGSGHPTVYPGGKYLITDTYTNEATAYGDGTIPLRWVDLRTGEEEVLVRINTAQSCEDSVMRIDPHPAWDRSWRYVTFNAFINGSRRVFVADMKPVLDKALA